MCIRDSGYGVLLFFWGMNGFVQSMVWSPILRLAGEYYDEKGKSKFGIEPEHPMIPADASIVFSDVSFSYPGAQEKALDHILSLIHI